MTKSDKMSPSHRQEFCVRWNSHLGSIGAAFPQLLAGQRFVDVTLACEGHQVHCHRLVLAACSSYFESILAENPCKHPVIILPSEIKLWEIQALVDFMYKGEVNVTQAGLPQLLRCAEQLRIRGLYGSDAALNLNQLKALTGKNQNLQQTASNNHNSNSMPSTGMGGGGGGSGVLQADSNDEDTATNSTTTTTATATSTIQSHPQNVVIKKEPMSGPPSTRPVLTPVSLNSLMANPAAVTNFQHQQQDSGDESTSNAYEQYENSQNANNISASNVLQQNIMQQQMSTPSESMSQNMATTHHMDSTIEEDHNYVAHDEDDSFGGVGGAGSGVMADTEHDSSANNSMMHTSMDQNSSLRRIRRSEESLEQAAKCVSKGQTFQTVSNMFNIPVSTIRFYMARKGILPKRKRGRGASSAGSGSTGTGGAANVGNIMSLAGTGNMLSSGIGGVIANNPAALAMSAAQMSQALAAQMKQRASESPNSGQFSEEAAYHLMGYKMKTEAPRLV
ncbi:broad-complex core protein isoforms 1/2/3/4/5 [Musca domestica]|uniref:Broad-complex core protein isoforms 1/2/3/4/5 n=1 Tax=Musca domestica TaxID=7370 RepID=A0A9J7DFZ1_MUSDO|nr:broad-complex core protein isoforms 1/2/3/4/5 [Musca domestica]XP_019893048.2 broad-complex core protein isoforms 1/2/3/4/5 [Musca domestica]XP_019893049.2 broad-complex core protein isoforms 1/2/3/4/5 [Musca domestica]